MKNQFDFWRRTAGRGYFTDGVTGLSALRPGGKLRGSYLQPQKSPHPA